MTDNMPWLRSYDEHFVDYFRRNIIGTETVLVLDLAREMVNMVAEIHDIDVDSDIFKPHYNKFREGLESQGLVGNLRFPQNTDQNGELEEIGYGIPETLDLVLAVYDTNGSEVETKKGKSSMIFIPTEITQGGAENRYTVIGYESDKPTLKIRLLTHKTGIAMTNTSLEDTLRNLGK